MIVLQYLALSAAGLLAALIVFLAYMGMFSTPAVVEKNMGPYTGVYEPFVGDYKKTGAVGMKIYESLKADGVETFKGFGIYYDDPRVTPGEKLRSDVGSILEEKDLARVPELAKKYRIKKLPARQSIVAEFPVRNPLSYMLAPMKTYPAITKYAQHKGCKYGMPYEIYDVPAKKIYLVMEIIKD
jgi:hypothetical protein